MQLSNKLYTIISKRGDIESPITFELCLIPECFIYDAHFPGQPITPGVCIVQIGKELLEEVTGETLDIVYVKNVKFLSVLVPQESSGLNCVINKVTWSEDGNEVKAQLVVNTATELKAKMSLVCKVHGRAR